MLAFSSSLRYFVYSTVTDMRKGFDGLSGLVRNHLLRDPTCGDVFIFINGPKTHIKLLFWDGDGYVIYYKRLEKGTFDLPKSNEGCMELKRQDLMMILEGIKLEICKKKVRFLSRKIVD
jgi:transposase